MHRLTGELHEVHLQLIRGEGTGGDGWADILGQCKGTTCAKVGQRNVLPPESQAKEDGVYSMQCLCGPLCRRGVRDIWTRTCKTLSFQHFFPPQMPPVCHLHIKAQRKCSLLQEALLAPPDVQSLRYLCD